MKLPFSIDNGFAEKAAIGLIVLESDETLEVEFRQTFRQKGVALYQSRIPNAPEITPETLAEMKNALPQAARLLPRTYPLGVVGYGCTSGATIIGPQTVAELINSVHPTARVTDPISATIAALHHVGAKNIAIASPYIAEVSAAMRDLLERKGFKITGFGSFEEEQDAIVARITTASIYEAICALGKADDVDAVFVACTNLRTFDIIERAEAAIGKPVVSSNQAFAWHMQTLAGLDAKQSGLGKLFS